MFELELSYGTLNDLTRQLYLYDLALEVLPKYLFFDLAGDFESVFFMYFILILIGLVVYTCSKDNIS